MGGTLLGPLASSSLIIGGLLALMLPIGERLLGLIMGFGAGVLISAVAYELVAEAFETSAGNGTLALGLAAGALTFFAGDMVIDRMGGDGRKTMHRTAGTGSALAIVLGIVLDGIPESAVIGLGLLEGKGVSVAVLAAVFLSNLPEAMAATTACARAAGSPAGSWACGCSSRWSAGCAHCSATRSSTRQARSALAFVLAFAGGAILTMLADTMMPEAYEHGGKLVGLLTTLGFGLAFALTMLD